MEKTELESRVDELYDELVEADNDGTRVELVKKAQGMVLEEKDLGVVRALIHRVNESWLGEDGLGAEMVVGLGHRLGKWASIEREEVLRTIATLWIELGDGDCKDRAGVILSEAEEGHATDERGGKGSLPAAVQDAARGVRRFAAKPEDETVIQGFVSIGNAHGGDTLQASTIKNLEVKKWHTLSAVDCRILEEALVGQHGSVFEAAIRGSASLFEEEPDRIGTMLCKAMRRVQPGITYGGPRKEQYRLATMIDVTRGALKKHGTSLIWVLDYLELLAEFKNAARLNYDREGEIEREPLPGMGDVQSAAKTAWNEVPAALYETKAGIEAVVLFRMRCSTGNDYDIRRSVMEFSKHYPVVFEDALCGPILHPGAIDMALMVMTNRYCEDTADEFARILRNGIAATRNTDLQKAMITTLVSHQREGSRAAGRVLSDFIDSDRIEWLGERRNNTVNMTSYTADFARIRRAVNSGEPKVFRAESIPLVVEHGIKRRAEAMELWARTAPAVAATGKRLESTQPEKATPQSEVARFRELGKDWNPTKQVEMIYQLDHERAPAICVAVLEEVLTGRRNAELAGINPHLARPYADEVVRAASARIYGGTVPPGNHDQYVLWLSIALQAAGVDNQTVEELDAGIRAVQARRRSEHDDMRTRNRAPEPRSTKPIAPGGPQPERPYQPAQRESTASHERDQVLREGLQTGNSGKCVGTAVSAGPETHKPAQSWFRKRLGRTDDREAWERDQRPGGTPKKHKPPKRHR